jgi:hypothetical protein
MSHATYYVIHFEDGQYMTVSQPMTIVYDTEEKINNKILYEVAKFYAFDDCHNDRIDEIVISGRQVAYGGWMPDMRMQFYDVETGEIVYDRCFPEWDH